MTRFATHDDPEALGPHAPQPLPIATRDAILAADDAQTEVVAVSEWGLSVIVKALTGEQRDAFEASIMRQKDGGETVDTRDMRAKFVARCVVDEKGNRLFTNEDVKVLSRKSARALQRVFDVGARLAGMSKESVASLEGNSDAQSDASTTD